MPRGEGNRGHDVTGTQSRCLEPPGRAGLPLDHPGGPRVRRRGEAGRWDIVLTATRPVPKSWFPDPLPGKAVLCLASGGGQQAPSSRGRSRRQPCRQLAATAPADRSVAERDSLRLKTVEGDMRDLSVFADARVRRHRAPGLHTFVPDVRPGLEEAFRCCGSADA